MGVAIEVKLPGQVEADVVALPIVDAEGSLAGTAAALDERLGGRLGRLRGEGGLGSALGETTVLHVDGELRARRVAAAGVGPREGLDTDSIRTAAAAAVRATRSVAGSVAWMLDDSLPLSLEEQARGAIEGALLGSYDPGRWKTKHANAPDLTTIALCGDGLNGLGPFAERVARVAESANRARDLANAPPNELTPERLAERARELAGSIEHVTTEALGPPELEELGMGAFAAVGRASENPARLVVVRYDPPEPTDKALRVGLVGKAITFDSGGLSIKPALKMYDMKGDMSGGAAALEGIGAVAELGLPVTMVAVIAACENLPGGNAFRPGDILTAANGTTIEVTNTDAEGRLVLADALWYARREGATHLLDLATLTGAMEVALGDLYAGVFSNDERWRDEIVAAGKRSGDHVWPFPMNRRYRRYIESPFADLKNSSELRQAGAVLAAEFLQEFAGDGPWAHIDMAGPAFLERSRGDYLTQPGGTGYGVRLIVELAVRLAA